MCTIALAWRLFDEAPLVVGANREERWGRPADPPGWWETRPNTFAPRDTEAGGTWIGLNEAGVFAALTNRPADLEGQRSRGLLLRDLLDEGDAGTARGTFADLLDADQYGGFNLVVATDVRAWMATWDGELHTSDLERGLHVIVNRGDAATSPRGATVRSRLLGATLEDPPAFRSRLRTVLADHPAGTCVHHEERGTRSSSIVTRYAAGGFGWAFANGPPCETTYRDVRKGEH